MCKTSLKLSQIHISQLEPKFDTIGYLVGHKQIDNTCKGTGLFNGVSKTFNWLFGIPDFDDATYYNESIRNLNTQGNDLTAFMKQQLHIISNAIKNYLICAIVKG